MPGEPRTQIFVAAAVLAGLALATSGCSVSPPPQVLVSGSASTLHELAGEWRGEYWSAQSGRSGTLRFTLAAQADGSATGEVIMVLDQRRRPRRDDQAMPVVQPLAIRFVAMEDGTWCASRRLRCFSPFRTSSMISRTSATRKPPWSYTAIAQC